MRKWNKLLALLLAMVMALSLTVTGFAAEGSAEDAEEPAATDGITVLYTNDVHTYISEDLTYSKVAAYRDTLENVLLLDAGDHIQGTAYGGMDNGKTIIDLMNAAGYDLGTLGNHEFDYGMEGCMNAIEWAEFPYVSCNFYHEENGVVGESVLDSYKVFEVNGTKIAFIGITTPESFTKSTPAYFQDGEGNYIYGIAGGNDGAALYETVQTAIDAASEEADLVIALGHLGIDPSSSPWTSEEVIANTTGLDAFIDGHSHSTVPMKEVTDKDGNTVVLTQTGSYLATLGQMTIAADGTITTKLLTAEDLADITPDADVQAIEESWVAEVDEMLGEKVASSEIDFTVNLPESETRAVRMAETNLGDLNADAYYWYSNEVAGLDTDFAIMNGGGIRANADAGDWSYRTCKTINTFGNVLCVIRLDGQAVLDALEFGSRFVDAEGTMENGGFLHVAGLTYEIDLSVPNTVKTDDKNVWTAGPEVYRVTNVQVYNKETSAYEPLELDKTYTMAGSNYTLLNCGDGFNMFTDVEKVLDGTSEDYLAMAAYVAAFTDTDNDGCGNIASANSPLAAYEGYLINYEDPTGAGRITNVEGTPATEPAEPTEPAAPAAPAAATFSDVTESNWHYEFVTKMAEEGVVNGYADGSFKPNDSVKWGEALKMVVSYVTGEEKAPVEGGTWASGYIAYVQDNGIWEDEINQNDVITREEMCVVLAKMLKVAASEKDSIFPDTDNAYVMALVELGIIDGIDGSFQPDGVLTRAQLCKILATIPEDLEPAEDAADDAAEPAEGEDAEAETPAEGEEETEDEAEAPASDDDAPAETEGEDAPEADEEKAA